MVRAKWQARQPEIGLSLAVFATTFLTYLLTMPPGLTWAFDGGDGGELITAAATLGVPHPPGYPTYVLLGHLVSAIPIGTAALRFNIYSAACAAVAAAVLALACFSWAENNRIVRHPRAAAFSAALMAFLAPAIWQQAIIAEVYALNLLLVSLLILALLKRSAHWTGLAAGLALTTHLTSAFLLLLIPFFIPLSRWKSLFVFFLIGSLPWLALPFLARTHSPVQWGDPTTLSGWWWVVSARIYAPNVFGVAPMLWFDRMRDWTPELLRQFLYVGWLFIPLGMYRARRSDLWRHSFLFCLVSLAYLLYAVSYDAGNASVYWLPILPMLALILTLGLGILGWQAAGLPLLMLGLNLGSTTLRGEQSIALAAAKLFSDVPDRALLVTPGDDSIFALWYYHYVDQQRPDIIPVDSGLFAFDWYRRRLAEQYPSLKHLEEDDVAGFKQANLEVRSVCEAQLLPSLVLSCAPH